MYVITGNYFCVRTNLKISDPCPVRPVINLKVIFSVLLYIKLFCKKVLLVLMQRKNFNVSLNFKTCNFTSNNGRNMRLMPFFLKTKFSVSFNYFKTDTFLLQII
jgi:hypothetical protein